MRQIFAFFLSSLLTMVPARAEVDGKALHEEHCVSCHASITEGDPGHLYTRADRRVTSLAALEKQVRFCEQAVGLTWFDDEIDAVTRYLDQAFYHFEQ